MADDADLFRSNVKEALFDLTENYKLPGVDSETARVARDTAKQVMASVLQNVPKSKLKPP